MGEIAKLFVSYARMDEAIVAPLTKRLIESGFHAYTDRDVQAGQTWTDVVRSYIDASEICVFMVTQASLGSAYCETEVRTAYDMGKRVVPVYLEPIERGDVPIEWSFMRKTQAVEMHGGVDDWRALSKLVTDLGGGGVLRAFSAIGRPLIMVRDLLVLGEYSETYIPMGDASAMYAVATEIGRVATPFCQAGAAFAVPAYAPLAAACMAYLSGSCGGAPMILWPEPCRELSERPWCLSPLGSMATSALRDMGRKEGGSR